MWQWAWKSLLARRSGLVGGSLAVASAFALVLFFDAVYQGEVQRYMTYVRQMDADVWVMQRGVGNMHMASSFIWDSKADAVAAVPGVERVTPIVYMGVMLKRQGREALTYAVGLGREGARAGPWSLGSGRTVGRPGEIVVPAVLARLMRFGLGDTVSIGAQPLVVVGLSAGTYSQVNALVFTTMADLNDVVSTSGAYSYLLVDAESDVDARLLAARIRREVEKVNALTQEEFVQNDLRMGDQMGVTIILLMTVIAGAMAALMVAFTASTLVMRARRELAVARALGMRPRALLAAVALQAVVVTLLGALIAVAAAATLVPLIPRVVPQIAPILIWRDALRLGWIALFTAVAGTLLPAYMVTRVDPATVFQR